MLFVPIVVEIVAEQAAALAFVYSLKFPVKLKMPLMNRYIALLLSLVLVMSYFLCTNTCDCIYDPKY